jgi:hypothetical protein
MLDRSLKSLEKHKHVRAITQFAMAEYDFGSEERARTILEGKRFIMHHLRSPDTAHEINSIAFCGPYCFVGLLYLAVCDDA